MIKNSHNDLIFRHLKSGKTLTWLQALNKFGCGRLSARIYDIRDWITRHDMPYLLHSDMIKLANGKRVARYRIEKVKKKK